MKTLNTKEEIKALEGKTIRWMAPAYYMNSPFGGIAIIKEVNFLNYDELYGCFRRVIKAETVEGDDLNFAFAERYFGNVCLCYSDSGRFVSVEEV